MGYLSGKLGAVKVDSTVVPMVRQWGINHVADFAAFVSSGSKGATNRLVGNKEWNGTFDYVGHTPVPFVGESFTFLGSCEGAKGASGTAIVNRCTINVPIEEGGPIHGSCGFDGDGALTLGAAVVSDTAVPAPVSALNGRVDLAVPADPLVWTSTTINDVRNVELEFTAGNTPFASSSTSGSKKRLAGNIDGRAAIAVYTDDYATLPAVGVIKAARIYVTATTYWEIQWMVLDNVSDLLTDVEGNNIIGATLNFLFSGVTLIGSTSTQGTIKKPSGAVLWPV